jgi:tryptophan-rich hypothetical protein
MLPIKKLNLINLSIFEVLTKLLINVGNTLNKISPKKLLNSKWSAVVPLNKEKHFIITDVEYDEDKAVVSCIIEAIMSKRSVQIQWRDLKDIKQWVQGWK